MFAIMQNMNNESRTVGRPVGIAQSGNLPHGLKKSFMDSDYYKNLSLDDKNLLMQQMVKSYLYMIGVSQDSFRKAKGPDNTPITDGLYTIMNGPVTCKLFTGQPLRPMAYLVLDLVPNQQHGRSGTIRYQNEGAERYPFTMREYDPHTPQKWIRQIMRNFSQDVQTPQKYGATPMLPFSSARSEKDHPMLENDRNAANIVTGVFGMASLIIEELLKKKILSVVNVGGAGFVNDAAGASVWRTRVALGVFGIDGSTGTGVDHVLLHEMIKSMSLDARETMELHKTRGTNALEVLYQTFTASALPSLLSGVQDVASVSNRIVARNINTRQPKYGKIGSGSYDNDLWIMS
jgi:hypothetical protein